MLDWLYTDYFRFQQRQNWYIYIFSSLKVSLKLSLCECVLSWKINCLKCMVIIKEKNNYIFILFVQKISKCLTYKTIDSILSFHIFIFKIFRLKMKMERFSFYSMILSARYLFIYLFIYLLQIIFIFIHVLKHILI